MRWTRSNNNIRSSYEFLPVSISIYRKFEKSIKRLTDYSSDYFNAKIFPLRKFSSLQRKTLLGNRVALGMCDI